MLKKMSKIMEKHSSLGEKNADYKSSQTAGAAAGLLEDYYEKDEPGLTKVLVGHYGAEKAKAMLVNRKLTGTWLDQIGIGSLANLKTNGITKVAMSVGEEDSISIVKAMLGSQLSSGYQVSDRSFKKIYKILQSMFHPDVMNQRAERAEAKGNPEEAERIRGNNEKAKDVSGKLSSIGDSIQRVRAGNEGTEVNPVEYDGLDESLSGGMGKINEIYPFAYFINFMLASNLFIGFYVDDLAKALVLLDRELPPKARVGIDKFKSFFESNGVSLPRVDYIEDYYKKFSTFVEHDNPLLNEFFGSGSSEQEVADEEFYEESSVEEEPSVEKEGGSDPEWNPVYHQTDDRYKRKKDLYNPRALEYDPEKAIPPGFEVGASGDLDNFYKIFNS